MYQWELDGPAQQEFTALPSSIQAMLAAFMDAVVIVDPVQYQRRHDERDDVSMPLRTLHFGQHDLGPLGIHAVTSAAPILAEEAARQ
jgi:hypothetical protein